MTEVAADGQSDEIRTLRAHVDRFETERELERVLARYSFYADLGRLDDWLALFTDDGFIETTILLGGGAGRNEVPRFELQRAQGHAELRDLIFEAPAVAAMRGRSQHHMSGCPMLVFVDGDDAVIEAYAAVFVLSDGAGGETRASLSSNRWTFRRVDGSWKIASCIRRHLSAQQEAAVFARA
jgi:hypothetical protein